MLISDLKTIGNKLYVIRKKSGLSQEEVAWQAGISSRTYADIERGETNARIESIIKICGVFNITPDDILTEKDDDTGISEDKLLVQLDFLPVNEKKTAFKILEAYVKAVIRQK